MYNVHHKQLFCYYRILRSKCVKGGCQGIGTVVAVHVQGEGGGGGQTT